LFVIVIIINANISKMPVLSAAVKRLSLASVSSVQSCSPSKPPAAAAGGGRKNSLFASRPQAASSSAAQAQPGNKMVSAEST